MAGGTSDARARSINGGRGGGRISRTTRSLSATAGTLRHLRSWRGSWQGTFDDCTKSAPRRSRSAPRVRAPRPAPSGCGLTLTSSQFQTSQDGNGGSPRRDPSIPGVQRSCQTVWNSHTPPGGSRAADLDSRCRVPVGRRSADGGRTHMWSMWGRALTGPGNSPQLARRANAHAEPRPTCKPRDRDC